MILLTHRTSSGAQAAGLSQGFYGRAKERVKAPSPGQFSIARVREPSPGPVFDWNGIKSWDESSLSTLEAFARAIHAEGAHMIPWARCSGLSALGAFCVY